MTSASKDTGTFSPRCLSLDLEVGVQDRRIHAFAALRPDTGGRLVFHGENLAKALAELDALAEGAAFLLGHNLIFFDLSHLAAAKPDLRLLGIPPVDTLWLNPLAFPRNPYHRLVKGSRQNNLFISFSAAECNSTRHESGPVAKKDLRSARPSQGAQSGTRCGPAPNEYSAPCASSCG